MKNVFRFALVAAVLFGWSSMGLAKPDTRRHLQFVGTSDLDGDPSFTGDVDVDATGGVAYVGAAFTERGVAVIDISDPSDPRVERFLDTCFDGPDACSDSIDVKIVGNFLAVSSEPVDAGAFGGATLYDITDRLDPQLLDQFRVPGGTHNLFIDPGFPGRPFIYLANFLNTDVVDIVDFFDPSGPSLVAQLTPSDEPIGCQDPACPGEGFGGPLASPHDLFVQRHPDTGRHLAYVAYWDAGLRIYDVTDPVAATPEVGVFDVDPPPSDPETLPCCVHFAHPTPSGAFVLIEEEVAVGDSGDVRILDATGCDGVTTVPCTPTLVSSWQPPQGHARQAPSYEAFVETGHLNFGWFQRFFSFDVHNLDVRENEFVAAAYDAGIRLVDITDKANPVEIASFIPVLNVKNAAIGPEFQPAETWTARFGDDGNIYASDFFTGFHVVRPVGPGN